MTTLHRTKLGGYIINYPDKSSLHQFWKEIFINEEYSFNSHRKDPQIIDCGSNIGLSILYFKSKYSLAQILAFEPDPNSYIAAKENIRANGLHDVQIYEVALSNKIGQQKFYGYTNVDNTATVGNSLMRSWGERVGTSEITVKTEKLSKYINQTVDFLKLNIEGSEQQVMEDLFESGKIKYIKEIYLQYHQTNLENTDTQLKKIIFNLEQIGFVIKRENKQLEKYLPTELQSWVDSVKPSFTVLHCKQQNN